LKAGDYYVASLGFTGSQTAVMTNAINIAKIIGSLSVAGIIAKFGNRKTFTFSALLIVLGFALTMTNGFMSIFFIRFILGLGGAWVLVTINPIVIEIFEGKELTIVNGINAVAFNVGLAMSLLLATPMKGNPSGAITVISVLILICSILWYVLSRDFHVTTSAKKADEEKYTFKDGMKDKFNWVFALSYAGLLAFYLVSFTFMEPATVKYVIFAGIFGAVFGTQMASKVEDKLKLVRISGLVQLLSAIGFLALYENPIAKVLGIILGFSIFYAMPAYVTLAYKRPNITPKKISITFSMFWAIAYGFSIIIVQTFGILSDTSESKFIPFLFIICSEATFFIGSMFFMKKDQFVK